MVLAVASFGAAPAHGQQARDLPALWAAARAADAPHAGVATPVDLPQLSAESVPHSAIGAQAQSAAARIDANKSYAIPALEILGFEALLNQFDRRVLGTDFASNISTVRRNLHSSWVVDRDPFTVNQLGHPYAGSMYQGFARASGLDYWEALGYVRGKRSMGNRGRAQPPVAQ